MVTCFPVHDHRFGPCTLPEKITAENGGGCHWSTTYDRIGRMEGAREWYHMRRRDRRRSRHQARRELRLEHFR